MRLGLLIKDIEYRKALIERIADYDSDVLIDVISGSDPVEADALIITDVKPAELGQDLFNIICKRTVFLNTGERYTVNNHTVYSLFKYSSVSRLLAELSDIYAAWQGIEIHKASNSKVIAVCTDSDAFSGSRCSSFASQIIYTHGGRVLILPLSYINEDAVDYGRDINRFARLMYMVKSGRYIDPTAISYDDSYGISRLMLPRGRNPVAYLEGEDLDKLIFSMSRLFDTVILDIATCYREENLNVIKNADHLLCFESGRRRVNFSGLMNIRSGEQISDSDDERMKIIKFSADSNEAYAIDEFIKDVYGSKNGSRADYDEDE